MVGGDHPDPNVLKDGDDYYAVFSTFDYYPGATVWRSHDLINWTPVGPAVAMPIGTILALDLAKVDGRYFIYIPAVDVSIFRFDRLDRLPIRTWVVHADTIEGPWSEPTEVGVIGRFDPGHVTGEDGQRYLFFDDGHRVRLTGDGLKADGAVTKVYDGWAYPNEWIDDGKGLEGPKLLQRGDWFYMFSAQGGTGGAPTSHMVIVARSRSIDGPWENCPHNPIVRTRSRHEPWWSRGHATPVQGPGGAWWLVYHGYENGLRSLGRQMLLEPMVWTADGWPRATGGDLSHALPAPHRPNPPRNGAAPNGQRLSGPFAEHDLGRRLVFFNPAKTYRDRIAFHAGALTLKGVGTGPADSSPLTFIPGDRSYEFSVEMETEGKVQAGVMLFYNPKLFCGLGFGEMSMKVYLAGKAEILPTPRPPAGQRMFLRVVNDENVASFYWGKDGKTWTRLRSFDVSGYNHNIGGGFLSLRPAFFAARDGSATFRDLVYRARPVV